MPGLVPGIHVFAALPQVKTWMAGTTPGHFVPGAAMTGEWINLEGRGFRQ
jgi:hypothetical protein